MTHFLRLGVGFVCDNQVRRQFKLGLLEGTVKPDYAACVDIVTTASLRQMVAPGLIAVISPLLVGMVAGPECLAGMLTGSIVTGSMLAIMMANAGGAWDNCKKYIESGPYGGKGSEAHKVRIDTWVYHLQYHFQLEYCWNSCFSECCVCLRSRVPFETCPHKYWYLWVHACNLLIMPRPPRFHSVYSCASEVCLRFFCATQAPYCSKFYAHNILGELNDQSSYTGCICLGMKYSPGIFMCIDQQAILMVILR